MAQQWRSRFLFLRHAWSVMAGSRYWILPILPLIWLVVQKVYLVINDLNYLPEEVQGPLIAAPLTAIGVFLGMRIIAGEIDDRSLEVAYTVPGGPERLWMIKLSAAMMILISTEILLALGVWLFFTPFPPGALYGALQASTFYLILSMALGTLFRGEAAGAIVTLGILGLNGLITQFGDNQVRISPFFNPYMFTTGNSNQYTSAEEILAWTIQNRAGMLLAMAAIAALAFMRANRRETMLDGT
ncbi:MAG: hypothetical protein MKZ98_00830 [Pseudomonadales bacterium]|nr:hypothetical protein [Pseudomonadales bacterium]